MNIYNLVSFQGFMDEFWSVYRSGEFRSQEAVFEFLDDAYFERFGEHRFKSFSSFRYQRDVKHKAARDGSK